MACSSDDSKSVDVVIQNKQEFAKRLADLYFMDSWVSRAGSSTKDSIKTMLTANFEDLHGISVEDFHAKLAVLKTDPLLYAEIMDSVGVFINKKGKVKK